MGHPHPKRKPIQSVLITCFSAGVCIIRRILKILLFQPLSFFFAFGNINSLYLKDNGTGSVIAASNHHSIVICPLAHNRSALQCRIHVSADSIPRFTAKLSVHQMIKIILSRRSFQNKRISRFEKRTRSRFGISQILFLQLRKNLGLQYGYFAFISHKSIPLFPLFSNCRTISIAFRLYYTINL